MEGAHLVNQKLRDRLLLNFYHILSEDLFSTVPLIGIQPGAESLHVCPLGVFPTITQNEFVLQWVKAKSNVSIVQGSQVVEDGVVLIVVFVRPLFLAATKHC